MPTWLEYKQVARSRGALAFELFVVVSTPAVSPDELAETLPDHIAYLKEMEKAGALAFAGPLSDDSGEEMNGEGMLFYRAESFAAARELAEADPEKPLMLQISEDIPHEQWQRVVPLLCRILAAT